MDLGRAWLIQGDPSHSYICKDSFSTNVKFTDSGFSAGKRFGGNGIQPATIGTGCFCTGDVGKGRNDIPMARTPADGGAGGRGRAAGCVSMPQSRAGALSFCGDRSVTRQRRRERGKDSVLA